MYTAAGEEVLTRPEATEKKHLVQYDTENEHEKEKNRLNITQGRATMIIGPI